jgi:hypothetical protein
MKYFLLVYDRARGQLLGAPKEYPLTSVKAAVDARNELLHSTHGGDVEVVLLGADSIEDLQRTHRRYFLTHGVEEVGAAR